AVKAQGVVETVEVDLEVALQTVAGGHVAGVALVPQADVRDGLTLSRDSGMRPGELDSEDAPMGFGWLFPWFCLWFRGRGRIATWTGGHAGEAHAAQGLHRRPLLCGNFQVQLPDLGEAEDVPGLVFRRRRLGGRLRERPRQADKGVGQQRGRGPE